MRLEEDSDGNFVVVANKEPMTSTIAVRLPASTHAMLLPFVETFPERTLSVALRWLLDDPAVRSTIAGRVERNTTKAKAKT